MLTSRQDISNRKAFITRLGLTQKEIYQKMGISRIGFYKAIKGTTKNPEMHKAIFKAMKEIKGDIMDFTQEEFWPEFDGIKDVSAKG